MNNYNLKHLLAFLMLFLSMRVMLLYNDFLTAAILFVFGISILTHKPQDE